MKSILKGSWQAWSWSWLELRKDAEEMVEDVFARLGEDVVIGWEAFAVECCGLSSM